MNGPASNQTELEFAPSAKARTGTVKRCKKCDTTKSIDEFNFHSRTRGERHSYCRVCTSRYGRGYYRRNLAKYQLAAKRRSKESNTAYTRGWRKKNRERNLATQHKYWDTNKSRPEVVLRNRMRAAIYASLAKGKNGRSWEQLVGYTCHQLREHLEKLFLPGMSWENRSEWHIDHKIPISAFLFRTPEDSDFMRCWGLENLQPLWAHDNQCKQNKF